MLTCDICDKEIKTLHESLDMLGVYCSLTCLEEAEAEADCDHDHGTDGDGDCLMCGTKVGMSYDEIKEYKELS